MKIGIITWFGGGNYGTNLQAIALQYYLRSYGHEVKILNFKVPTAINRKKRSFFQRLYNQPEKYIMKYFSSKYEKEIEKRYDKIEETVKKYCIFTRKINDLNEYISECNAFDLIICGSDQIWNPNWYSKFYYADFPQITTKKISYAPSLGVNSISDKNKKLMKESLATFDYISVRENSGAEILKNILEIPPQVVVDPTLLLKKECWTRIALESKNGVESNYVLGVFLTDNIRHWHATKAFAKSKGMQLAIVPYSGLSYMQTGKRYLEAGLEDVLALIKNAKYVVTDSFHISVFSLIFQRQFIIFQRFKENKYSSQNSRIINLLKMLNLDKRLLSYGSNKIPNMQNIDYKETDVILQDKIKESEEWLWKAIGGETIEM